MADREEGWPDRQGCRVGMKEGEGERWMKTRKKEVGGRGEEGGREVEVKEAAVGLAP